MAVEDARYETLGQLAYDGVPEDAEKILLYVEFVGDGVISPSLFYSLGNDLHHVDSDATAVELFKLQEIFGPEVKALEFAIDLRNGGDSARARYIYADKFNSESDTTTRTDDVLRKYFGHASAKYESF